MLGGLEEGESVVTNGAFKIDSALQIQGRPSLLSMAPGPGDPGLLPDDPEFAASLRPLYEAYRAVAVALAADDDASARTAMVRLRELAARGLDVNPSPRDRRDWEEHAGRLTDASAAWAADADLATIRTGFDVVSNVLIDVAMRFGHTLDTPLYRIHCPMAFDDRGADWLQVDPEVRNPYYGAAMLRCGDVVTPLPAFGESAP